MPTLKQISCSVELGSSNTKFKEYGSRYSDGHVEAFIAVPDTDVPFTVQLRTEGYIAPGIAFFIFMDGEYQCNRNRVGLKLPGDEVQPSAYEVEFRLRQKEEKTSAGSFVVREWTFAKLNRVAADKAPTLNQQFLNNVGTIEIIVLRCKTENDDPPAKVLRGPAKQLKPESAKPESGKPAKVSSRAPSVAADPPPSALGGMFGLFDGACDEIDFAGAGDRRRVDPKGRVEPQSPPGMEWDSIQGEFRPASQHAGHDGDTYSTIRRRMRKHQEGPPQYDAHDGPSVVINQWGDRGRDDMRGDKYRGQTGPAKHRYKQYVRETGYPVSETAHGAQHVKFQDQPNHVQTSRFNFQNYTQKPQQAGMVNNYELQRTNSGPCAKAFPDQQNRILEPRRLVKPLSFLLQNELKNELPAPKGELRLDEDLPIRLRELLKDTEAMRETAIRAAPFMTHDMFASVMQGLTGQQKAILGDQALREPILNSVEGLREVVDFMEANKHGLQLLYHEIKVMAKNKVQNYTAPEMEERIQEVEGLVLAFQGQIERLRTRDNKAQDDAYVQDKYTNQPYQFNEAANNCNVARYPGPNDVRTPGGFNWDAPIGGGMEEVGAGSVSPYRRQTPGGQNFKAKNQACNDWGWQTNENGIWPQDKQATAHFQTPTAKQRIPAWDTRQNPAQTKPRSWDEGKVMNQGDAAGTNWPDFENQNSRHSAQQKSQGQHSSWHPFSQQDEQKDHWVGGSHHASKGGGGSNHNNDYHKAPSNDQKQGWSVGSRSKQDNAGGWDTNTKQSGMNERGTSSRKAQDADPKAHIKPYWKDWNKPVGSCDASDAKANIKREESRKVYAYPSDPPAAVPSDKVKDASYGIRAGKGTDYSHKCRRPIYIDTMESPYAVFSFKYRSKEALEKILKLKINDMDIKKIEKQAAMDRFSNMPKHELVKELVNKRTPQNGSTAGASRPRGNEAVNWNAGAVNSKASEGGWSTKGGNDNGGWGAQNVENGGGDQGWGEAGGNGFAAGVTNANGRYNNGNGNGGWDGSAGNGAADNDGWASGNKEVGRGDNFGTVGGDQLLTGWSNRGSHHSTPNHDPQNGPDAWGNDGIAWNGNATPAGNNAWGRQQEDAAKFVPPAKHKSIHERGWKDQSLSNNNHAASARTVEHFGGAQGGLCDTSKYFRQGNDDHRAAATGNAGASKVDNRGWGQQIGKGRNAVWENQGRTLADDPAWW